jgi:serine protease inhibitor
MYEARQPMRPESKGQPTMQSMTCRLLVAFFVLGAIGPVGQIKAAFADAPMQESYMTGGTQEPRGPELADAEGSLARQAGEIPTQDKTKTGQCGASQMFEKWAITPQLIRAKAGFALDLISRLSPKGQNVSVSPFGLSAVLATLDVGADPALRKAIAATLHIAPGAGKLEALRRESRLISLAVQQDPRRFASFNAVVDHRLPLKPGIKDLATAEGNVDLQSVDFESQAGVDAINELLVRKTNGRIKSILEPGPAPTLVAANAFAFKDCWKTPFDTSKTADRPFARPDGSKVERPTMSVMGNSIGYRTAGRYVAVELPYIDENFALTLVTTDREPAKAADFKKAGALLAGIDFADVKATLSLPKFTWRSR